VGLPRLVELRPLRRRSARRPPRGFGLQRFRIQVGFEDDMGRAVTVRRLQLVTDIAVRRERQTPFRDRRAADIPAQPLELLALVGARRMAAAPKEARPSE